MFTRRDALYLGLGTLIGATVSNSRLIPDFVIKPQNFSSSRTFPVETNSSLAEKAKAKGISYGSAILYHHLKSNQQYTEHILRECSMIVPEWELKWSAGSHPLRPTPDTFDFTSADAVVSFADNYKLLLRGHTLVWQLSLPKWFSNTITTQNAEAYLTNHIQTVVKRYAGRIHSWDVVNEAIEISDGHPAGLRKTPWLDFLGADYIDLAFRIAAEADPKTLLVYNDYGLEYDTPEHDFKRAAVLKLLDQLKAQGTPIHAFGMQSHLDGRETRFNAKKLRQFLSDVASLGLKILVTELDVTDKNLPSDIAIRDRIVAAAYEDYLNVVLDEPAVIAVLTWGLSDRYTWLSEFEPRTDKLPNRPLPFDTNMNRKLAWNAIARAFEAAPSRPKS